MKHLSKILFLTFLLSFAGSVWILTEASNNPYLVENEVKKLFSDSTSFDRFHIGIKGESILKGEAIFTITDINGNQIYQVSFQARLLIGYGLVTIDSPTQAQSETYIKERIADFFNESNFQTPAINDNEEFSDYTSDKNTWDDIKSDRSATSFYYLIGEEDARKIAYSKKLKKVIMFYNCC